MRFMTTVFRDVLSGPPIIRAACLRGMYAFIFVLGRYGLGVLPDTELRPHYVVICEAFLPLLYKEIAKIPLKSNVGPSLAKIFALVEGSSARTVCIVCPSLFSARWLDLCITGLDVFFFVCLWACVCIVCI